MKRVKNVRKSMLLVTGGLITGAVGGIFACTKLISKDQAVEIVVTKLESWLQRQPYPASSSSSTSVHNNPHYYSHYSNRPNQTSSASRQKPTYETLIVPTRDEANKVITKMLELVSKYGRATVSDLYSLVGLPSDYENEKYGWISLTGVPIPANTGDGYSIDLPEPRLLKNKTD